MPSMDVVSSDIDDLGESNVSGTVSPGTRFKVKRGREENEAKVKKKKIRPKPYNHIVHILQKNFNIIF